MIQNKEEVLQSAPAQRFLQPRMEDEIDMVVNVRNILKQHLPENMISMFYDNSPIIIEALNKNSDRQRYNITQWFVGQFCSVEADTTKYRFYLIKNANHTEWLSGIEHGIMNGMIEYNLPSVLV